MITFPYLFSKVEALKVLQQSRSKEIENFEAFNLKIAKILLSHLNLFI